MKIYKRKIKSLGFCLIVLLMGGCSSSVPSSEMSYLDGYVAGKTDISGATLQVTYSDGVLISEKKAPATSDYGAFMISVPYVPYEFRVVSIGGTASGENVNYRLVGQFEAFNPDSDTIYLNFVTTLACVYLDRNPDKSLAEVTNGVKAFLDIPGEVNIGRGLYHQDKYFSPERFLEEAGTQGGVEIFMETLVEEMAQDVTAKHTFPPYASGENPIEAGPLVKECAGTTLGQAARNGCIAWGCGFALNIGMQELFPDMGGPSKADIKEMKLMLTEIHDDLLKLESEVLALRDQILAAITKETYVSLSNSLKKYITTVTNTYTKLKNKLQVDPETLNDDAKAIRLNSIKDQLNIIRTQIAPSKGYLHTTLFGDTNTKTEGLFKIYADTLKAQKRFLSKENYQNKVRDLFKYYNRIEAIETYLVIEYYRAGSPIDNIGPVGDEDDIKGLANDLYTESNAEMDWLNKVKMPDGKIEDRLRIPDSTYIYHGDNYNLMIYLPDNQWEMMIYPADWYMLLGSWWNQVDFTGGMTESIYFGICFVRKMNEGTWKYDFTNWRLPSHDHIKDMFGNWSGSSPGEFARSQGLTAMNSERFLPTWQEPETCETIECEYYWMGSKGDDENYGYFYYYTTNGEFGWMNWINPNYLNFMPVREMQRDEPKYYFW